jgi:signal transduction histidine kinase
MSVRVLFIDDSDDDVLLVRRAFKRGDLSVEGERVCTEDDLKHALRRGTYDIAVCDYTMPGFPALEALAILRALAPTLPAILVSGTIGEEAAAACMRAGAHDFVHKDNLARLVPVVQRELQDAQMRREKARAEAELDQVRITLGHAERLRALGQMAAGISHDLKNLLNPIALHMAVADRALGRGDVETVRGGIAEVRAAVERGLQVIERLRKYGRQSPELASDDVRLDNVAREAASLVQPRFVKTLRLRTEIAEVASFVGDANEILSALVNLLGNAADACLDSKALGSHEVTLKVGGNASSAWVEVSDDGAGMSEATRARLFEPFFTTKGTSGTGLGLAMVYACVKRHGGQVEVRSIVNEGSTFTLRFPMQQAKVDA